MDTALTPPPARDGPTERDVEAAIRGLLEETAREPLPPRLLALVQRLSEPPAVRPPDAAES